MSFWSMLKNTFRTPRRPRTHHTMSLVWPGGSEDYRFPISLPEHVESMLQAGHKPLLAVIWKHSGPRSPTGAGSMDLWRTNLLLYCPQSQPPATGGSPDLKQPD